MKKKCAALLLVFAGCGGGEPDAAPSTPAVVLTAPPEKIVAEFDGKNHKPEEFVEAVRQRVGTLKTEADADRVAALAVRVRDVADKTVRTKANQALEEALTAALASSTRADAPFLAIVRKLARGMIGPATVALRTYVRVDRVGAETLIYGKMFPATPTDRVVNPAAALKVAYETDPARARKALFDWLEGPVLESYRRDPNSFLSTDPSLEEMAFPILDADSPKESYKRLLGHATVSLATSFAYHYVQTRKDRHPLNDEDRVDVIRSLAATEHVFVRSLEPFLGPSLASSGEPALKAMIRLLQIPKIHSWGEFVTASLKKMGEAGIVDVFRRSAEVAPARLALRQIVQSPIHTDPEFGAMVLKGFAEILGRDEKEDEHWFNSFRIGIQPGGVEAVVKALARDGVPAETLVHGIRWGVGKADLAPLFPSMGRRLRSGEALKILKAMEGIVEQTLAGLAPDLIESYLTLGAKEYRGRVRRSVILKSGQEGAGPRLVAISRKVKDEETRLEVLDLIVGLQDRRVVEALAATAPSQADVTSSLFPAIRSLAGVEPLKGERLTAYAARARAKLPPQVEAIETPLGETAAPREEAPKPVASVSTPAPAARGRIAGRAAPMVGPPGALLYTVKVETLRGGGWVFDEEEGLVHAFDQTAYVTFDAQSGQVLRNVELFMTSKLTRAWSGGDAIVAAYERKLACFSKADGTKLWEIERPQPVSDGGWAGDVFVTGGFALTGFSRSSGEKVWEQKFRGSTELLVAGESGVLHQRTVVAPERKTETVWADPKTGADIWALEEASREVKEAWGTGRTLFLAGDQRTREVEAASGKVVGEWPFRILPRWVTEGWMLVAGAGGTELRERGTGRVAATRKAAPLAAGPRESYLLEGGAVVCIDHATGKERWKAATALGQAGSEAVALDGGVLLTDGVTAVFLESKRGAAAGQHSVREARRPQGGSLGSGMDQRLRAPMVGRMGDRVVFVSSLPFRVLAISAGR